MYLLKIIINIVFLLYPLHLGATCTGSSPNWNATPDYASVNRCVSRAKAGDTIYVSAGNGTEIWTSTLTITKGVNLIGPGGNNLTIQNGIRGGSPLSPLIRYEPSDYDANNAFRLSGFTFDANGTVCLTLGSSKSAPFTTQTKVRIHNNKFINTGAFYAGAAIYNFCTMYGVVENNTIDAGMFPIRHSSGSGINDWWVNSPQNIFRPGDSNFMFWEDNTIILSGSGDGLVTEGQFSIRYVFRYNTITMNVPSYSLFELHGYQPTGGMDSCFGAEVYGNQVTTNNNALTFFKTRAGKSFVFFNNATRSTPPSNAGYTGTTPYPCPPDKLAPYKVINNNYWFNNKINLTGEYFANRATADLNCAGLTGIPTLGRDIFSNNTTPGVSCGTLANLPEACDVGQGYWATNQSCSDLTGMVGKDPANPIQGTLYKCTATNTWTAYYTPYTYPHPLRTESRITPPKGRRIIQ